LLLNSLPGKSLLLGQHLLSHCFSADMQQTLLVLPLHFCLHSADKVTSHNKKALITALISSVLCLILFHAVYMPGAS